MGLIAACGGGATASSVSSSASISSATTSHTTPPPSLSPTPSAPSAGQADFALGTAAVKVGITDNTDPNGAQFAPAAVTVHVGDIVEWDYSPTAFIAHNIVFADQESLSYRLGLGAKPSGQPGAATWQVRFTLAGAYHYVCTFHPGMSGTVTVG